VDEALTDVAQGLPLLGTDKSFCAGSEA